MTESHPSFSFVFAFVTDSKDLCEVAGQGLTMVHSRGGQASLNYFRRPSGYGTQRNFVGFGQIQCADAEETKIKSYEKSRMSRCSYDNNQGD